MRTLKIAVISLAVIIGFLLVTWVIHDLVIALGEVAQGAVDRLDHIIKYEELEK